MKKALILGAGFTSKPLADYLLNHEDFEVTVTGLTVAEARKMTQDRPRGKAEALDMRDEAALTRLIEGADVAVSLLPYEFHHRVAKKCIEIRRPLVTTSYAKDEIYRLDAAARARGVLILKEMGLDPGIDHMSAMRMIDRIKARGGKVVSFKSSCGGIPAPESDNNPLRYKFSWSPKGVLLAAKSDVQYLEAGAKKAFCAEDLHKCGETLDLDEFKLESYPNRDSIPYLDFYGIPEAKTIQRATLRYPGWCATMSAMNRLGFLATTPLKNVTGLSRREITSKILALPPSKNEKKAIRQTLDSTQEGLFDRLDWLGLFDENQAFNGAPESSALDFLTLAMVEKMQYAENERDMIVLYHDIIADYDGRLERTTAKLIAYGEPGKYSAMSKTVALPAAVGAKLILRGDLDLTGVQIPVIPQIYNPVLDELQTLGIEFVETNEPAVA